MSIHPSIHPSIFYTCLIQFRVAGGAGAYPSGHWVRGGVHPGLVASPSQGHTETNETHNNARSLLESPMNLTCMFLDGGKKQEYPERTHTYTGRTCKPSCCEAMVLATTPPCSSTTYCLVGIILPELNTTFPEKDYVWMVA